MKRIHTIFIAFCCFWITHLSFSQDYRFDYKTDNPNFNREYNLRTKKIDHIPGSSNFKLLSNFTGEILPLDHRLYTQFWELDSSLNVISNTSYRDTSFDYHSVGYMNDFCHDSIGNTYTLGVSKTGAKVIMKIDTSGNPVWTSGIFGHHFSSILYNPINDKILVLGQEEVPSYDHDMLVLELDLSGALTNGITLSYPGFDDGIKIITTSTGYMVLGFTSLNGIIMTLASIDQNLNVKWAKTYEGAFSQVPFITISDMALSEDQSQLVIGGYHTFNSTDHSVYLLKIDTSGNEFFYKTYQTSLGSSMRLNSVKSLPDNQYLLGGNDFDTTTGLDHIFVMRSDSNGSILWANQHGSQINSFEELTDILPLPQDSQFLAVADLFTMDSNGFYNRNKLSIFRGGLNGGGNTCGTPLTITTTNLTLISDTINLTPLPHSILNPHTNYITNIQQTIIDTICFSADSTQPPPNTTIFEHYGFSDDMFILFPNPAFEKIQLKYTGSLPIKDVKITLFNSLGQIVLKHGNLSTEQELITLDIASLPSGIYTLNISDYTMRINKKFVLNGR